MSPSPLGGDPQKWARQAAQKMAQAFANAQQVSGGGAISVPIIGAGIVPPTVTDRRRTQAALTAPLGPELVAGPVLAWRVWKLRQDGVLLSVTQDCAWPIGIPLVGDPQRGNHEGVYAVKTREMLAEQPYGRDCLAGQVALWGHVIEHEHGYRAQYAYPYSIDLRPTTGGPMMPGFPRSSRRTSLAQLLRDNYGCEVIE